MTIKMAFRWLLVHYWPIGFIVDLIVIAIVWKLGIALAYWMLA